VFVRTVSERSSAAPIHCALPNNVISLSHQFCGAMLCLEAIWSATICIVWKERNQIMFDYKISSRDRLISTLRFKFGGGRRRRKKIYFDLHQ
jgi:hypothetical protein